MNRPPRTSLQRLIALPRLWWRAKGFGIHSPAAYEYVRSVVSEPMRYSAYERVDALCREAKLSRRTGRLLMRAALWEGCAKVCCRGVSRQVEEIATLWSADARVAAGGSMMAVGALEMPDKAILRAVERVAQGEGTVVLLDADKPSGASAVILKAWLADPHRPGVLLTDGRSAILYARRGVPAQYYEMRL